MFLKITNFQSSSYKFPFQVIGSFFNCNSVKYSVYIVCAPFLLGWGWGRGGGGKRVFSSGYCRNMYQMSDLNGVICPTSDEKGSQSPSFNCYDIPLVCKYSCDWEHKPSVS